MGKFPIFPLHPQALRGLERPQRPYSELYEQSFTMTPTELDLTTLDGYSDWLATEISRLSSQVQARTSIICVACGKVLGTYIFEYEDKTFRLPKEEALAFLTFLQRRGRFRSLVSVVSLRFHFSRVYL